jgi:hypothetical protein
MGVDQDLRAARTLRGDDRAHAVVGERTGERLHHPDQQRAHRFFDARRTGSVGQFLQGFGGAVHGRRGDGAE